MLLKIQKLSESIVIKYFKAFYYWLFIPFGKVENRVTYVFKVLKTLPDGNPKANCARYILECGTERLKSNSLPMLLRDEEYLQSLPDGSLGRAYLDFVRSEDVDMARFFAASAQLSRESLTDNEKAFDARMVELHDLIHVFFGYSRSRLGEGMVLTTQAVQLNSKGFSFIIKMGLLRIVFLRPWWVYHVLMVWRECLQRCKAAGWLPAYDWEQYLERDLTELRKEKGIGDRPRWYRYVEAASEL